MNVWNHYCSSPSFVCVHPMMIVPAPSFPLTHDDLNHHHSSSLSFCGRMTNHCLTRMSSYYYCPLTVPLSRMSSLSSPRQASRPHVVSRHHCHYYLPSSSMVAPPSFELETQARPPSSRERSITRRMVRIYPTNLVAALSPPVGSLPEILVSLDWAMARPGQC